MPTPEEYLEVIKEMDLAFSTVRGHLTNRYPSLGQDVEVPLHPEVNPLQEFLQLSKDGNLRVIRRNGTHHTEDVIRCPIPTRVQALNRLPALEERVREVWDNQARALTSGLTASQGLLERLRRSHA